MQSRHLQSLMQSQQRPGEIPLDATDVVGGFAAPAAPRPKVVIFGSIGSGKTALFRSARGHLRNHVRLANEALATTGEVLCIPAVPDDTSTGDECDSDALPPFSGRHAQRTTLSTEHYQRTCKARTCACGTDGPYAAWGRIAVNLRPSTTIEVHCISVMTQSDVPTAPMVFYTLPPVPSACELHVWDVPGTAAENPTLCTTVLRGAGVLAIAVDATVMRQVEATFGASALDSAASLAIPWLDAALKDDSSAAADDGASGATSPTRSAAASRPGTPRGVGGQRRTYPSNGQEEMATVVNVPRLKAEALPRVHSVVVVVTKIDAVAFTDQDHAMLEALRNVLQTRYQALAPRATFAAFACSAVTGCGVPDLMKALTKSSVDAIAALTDLDEEHRDGPLSYNVPNATRDVLESDVHQAKIERLVSLQAIRRRDELYRFRSPAAPLRPCSAVSGALDVPTTNASRTAVVAPPVAAAVRRRRDRADKGKRHTDPSCLVA